MADIKGRWVAHSVAFIVMILLICFSFHYDYRLSSILAVAGGASVFRVSTSLLISTRMFIKKKEGTSRVSSSMVQELPTGYQSSASSSPYSSAIGSSDTVYGYMAP